LVEVAFGRPEEADADSWTLGKAGVVGGAGGGDADDRRLGHRGRQVADAASHPQLAPLRAGALGEDADAGAVAQGLDRRVQRAAVALAASDRPLANAVEDRAEAADVPELGLGQ